MADSEAKRIRALVADQYVTWTIGGPCFDTQGIRQHLLRDLLWEIDHPSPEDQSQELFEAWRREVEPKDLVKHGFDDTDRYRPDLCRVCAWPKEKGSHA
ncbi:hypothetical protein [Streptomyces sp. NPDC014622]|uniref:hypothetical protein n=1 Tax=Streptomyces sp. NPDC014622 TaxID=3364874 RepID=UPI0036FBB1F0